MHLTVYSRLPFLQGIQLERGEGDRVLRSTRIESEHLVRVFAFAFSSPSLFLSLSLSLSLSFFFAIRVKSSISTRDPANHACTLVLHTCLFTCTDCCRARRRGSETARAASRIGGRCLFLLLFFQQALLMRNSFARF